MSFCVDSDGSIFLRNESQGENCVDIERDERWRLLLPAPLKDGRAALDAPRQQSAELLAFKVANGHMSVGAVPQADAHLADLDPSLECIAKRLGLDEPISLAWNDGERAAI